MSVSVHYCRALRAVPHESFRGPYPGPLNKYLDTINCAFVSVHCHRPKAWVATPMQGVSINLQHKSGAQCGAYGRWSEIQKHSNIKQQHVGWLAADLKVIQESSPFDEVTALNVWLYSSGQQANFGSAQYHCKVQCSCDHVLEGSAHLTPGDIDVAAKTRTSSSRSQTTLTEKEWIHPCPRSQATYRLEVQLAMRATGRCWHCTVDNLLYQGHMTLIGCW